jgi:hypothetical protein
MRPTTTVDNRARDAAAEMSNPPPLAAPLSAGIKLYKIVPPIPPPAAPEIILTRGLSGEFPFKR